MLTRLYSSFSSPLGEIILLASEEGLRRILISSLPMEKHLGEIKTREEVLLREAHAPFKGLMRWFRNYFAGNPVTFQGSLDLDIGTAYQKWVWQTLMTIPYGEVRSYRWVGEQVATLGAPRAVGQANGRNPLPILIPCHRVIYHNGHLGGYTGGIWIKRRLLELEGWAVRGDRVLSKDPALLGRARGLVGIGNKASRSPRGIALRSLTS